MSSSITGGRYIAEALRAHGVTHVFFMDAILRRALVEMEKIGIRRILAHSEKGAAYMADGYARVARRPAVCMAQSVGAANLAAGLQDAFLGEAAVIALTGRQPAPMQYRHAYQEVPHEPLFASVTKASMRVDQPEQLPLLLGQAFRCATTGRPGPVHVDIAGHTGDAVAAALLPPGLALGGAPYDQVPAFRLSPPNTLLQQAAEMIGSAARPVFVADMGVMTSHAEEVLARLAEQLSVPVVGSLDAKSVLLEEHPLNAGIVGTYSRSCANRVVAEADLVIFVGSRTGDQVTNNWTLPSSTAPVIQISAEPEDLGCNYPAALGVPGDPRCVLEALLVLCPSQRREAWVGRVHTLAEAWRREVAKDRDADAVPIRPERLCREVGRSLPDDAILVSDTGYSSQWSGTLVELRSAGQRYLRAAGSLGWAFPAAIGAKCAAADKPVICFAGDGAFMYHLTELETARRYGIPVIVVVNNNSCLAQGARAIKEAYRNQPGNPGEIHNFRPTNFAAIAKAMDCNGIRVERASEYGSAMARALQSDIPTVIDVVTDPEVLAPLPWGPE